MARHKLLLGPVHPSNQQLPRWLFIFTALACMRTQVKRFAQRYDVHVWLVAHPKQLMDWQGKAPSLYDISGSAHFINKADCGVVVHRCEGRSARQACLKPFSACSACQLLR